MKIPNEKQVAFLNKVISETQTNPGSWNRVMSDSIAATHVFPNYELDSEGVFSYIFPDKLRNGQFWIALCNDGKVRGAIGTDTDFMEPLDSGNKEIAVLLTRLFYMLFDRSPNAGKLIDDFLND